MTKEEILDAYRSAVETVIAHANNSINSLIDEKIAATAVARKEDDSARMDEIRKKLQS